MAKGYWIAHVDVDDPKVYEKYKEANAIAFAEYGARFMVRGGKQEIREGQMRARTVVIEFPSYEAAVECYESDAYQHAISIRAPVSTGDLAIIEGYDG
ncbi:MAG: DUF1330 domain-containing protein [Marinibacterium sp.]|nr:DUF1330 domain-containing protein [Marinibacterium sp.]